MTRSLYTMLYIMPAASAPLSPLESSLLSALGERIKAARRRAGKSAADLAATVGISRTTLHAVEGGEPSTTMGTYMRVLGALGMAGDMVMVGTGAGSASPSPMPASSGVQHRHLNHSGYTLAAIDDIISRGESTSWARLHRASLVDPGVMERVKAICQQHAGDAFAHRYQFWRNLVEEEAAA